MSSDRRTTCQVCGKHESEVGPISWRGKCAADSTAALYSNIEQMMRRSGPNFDRWRRSMAACVGGAILDDDRAKV